MKTNKEMVENFTKDYLDGMSMEECGRQYSVDPATVRNHLKKQGISTKLYNQKKYKYNEDFFELIDTEEKAYWLGFIAADGSITKNSTILDITLSVKDRDHLLKFIGAINGSEEMVRSKTIKSEEKIHEASRVLVCSPKMCSDLSHYGIVPKKGAVLDFPDFLEDDLMKHYLRGYFDGDGCFSTAGFAPSGAQKYTVSIIATESFLLKMMDFLLFLGITKVSLLKKYKMAIWSKGGIPQIKSFLNYIYKDSTVFLDRKHERYLSLCRSESKTTEDSELLRRN